MVFKVIILLFIFLIQSCGGIRIRLPAATVTSPDILDEQVELIPAVEWMNVRIDQRHESFAVGSLMMEIHFN